MPLLLRLARPPAPPSSLRANFSRGAEDKKICCSIYKRSSAATRHYFCTMNASIGEMDWEYALWGDREGGRWTEQEGRTEGEISSNPGAISLHMLFYGFCPRSALCILETFCHNHMSLDRMGDKAAKSGDPLPDRCAARMARQCFILNESGSQKRVQKELSPTSRRRRRMEGIGEAVAALLSRKSMRRRTPTSAAAL